MDIKTKILDILPYAAPYRFIDEIIEIDEDHIIASYQFKANESFYAGHFPGNPVTPGAILLKASAQAGCVAFGAFLAWAVHPDQDLSGLVTFFTEADVKFKGVVKPGEKIIVHAKKTYYADYRLQFEFEMKKAAGALVCCGTLGGIGIRQM